MGKQIERGRSDVDKNYSQLSKMNISKNVISNKMTITHLPPRLPEWKYTFFIASYEEAYPAICFVNSINFDCLSKHTYNLYFF